MQNNNQEFLEFLEELDDFSSEEVLFSSEEEESEFQPHFFQSEANLAPTRELVEACPFKLQAI